MCLGKLLFSFLLLYVCCLGDSWISVVFQIGAAGWYMEPNISLIGIKFIHLDVNSKLEYVPLDSHQGNLNYLSRTVLCFKHREFFTLLGLKRRCNKPLFNRSYVISQTFIWGRIFLGSWVEKNFSCACKMWFPAPPLPRPGLIAALAIHVKYSVIVHCVICF